MPAAQPKKLDRHGCAAAFVAAADLCLSCVHGRGDQQLIFIPDGDATAPLAPSSDASSSVPHSATGLSVSRCTGQSDSGRRKEQAQAGLAAVALVPHTDLGALERLRLSLAIGCLRMLSDIGRQGPAEGSVLDDDVIEDGVRRRDHRLAATTAGLAPPVRDDVLPPSGGYPVALTDTDGVLQPGAATGQLVLARRGAEPPPGRAALAEKFCGEWENAETRDLDEYLKHIGVGWAKRKVALSFRPEASWAVVDGVLQVMTPTPIGDRLEAFRIDVREVDTDPEGNTFWRRSEWREGRLVTTADDTQGLKQPFVTERWVDPRTGDLWQRTSHDGAAFTRIFTKKKKKKR